MDFTQFNPNLYAKEPDVDSFENLKKRILDVCK